MNGVQRYPEEYKQSYSHGVVYMDLSFEQREAIRNIIVWRELQENGQSTIHAVEPQADGRSTMSILCAAANVV